MSDHNRGGHEPPAEIKDTPRQNAGYDEAVKGAPLTPDEQRRATQDSPVGDNRRAGDEDGNRTAGNARARGPKEPKTAR